MKRIYTILSCVLLAALLLVGTVSVFDRDETYSESERRKLKTTPLMTFSSLVEGSFFSDYAEYFADTFPGRESLKQTNTTLNGFYYFGGLADEGEASLILDFTTNGAIQGEALPETRPTEAEEPTEEESQPQDVTEAPTEKQPAQSDPDPESEQLGSILLVGDSAFDIPTAKREQILRYADAISAIADALGSDIQTMVMPVPNSAEFYTSEEYHSGAASQLAMFELCRENMGENVTYVDAYAALKKHTDEYLYFRTDHHWTHLGAYYAYTALCEELGMETEPLEKFATGQWDDFVGTMYTYAANYPQARVLKENPDTVHYWKPFVTCKSYYYSDTTLSDPYPTGTICTVSEGVDNLYLTFMGGDHPVTMVETSVEGPCILVIKESYGNALVSWLTSHYSRIILIDPREYFAINEDIDLRDFAQTWDVEQCLIINYPMMLNSAGYITHLENLTK